MWIVDGGPTSCGEGLIGMPGTKWKIFTESVAKQAALTWLESMGYLIPSADLTALALWP